MHIFLRRSLAHINYLYKIFFPVGTFRENMEGGNRSSEPGDFSWSPSRVLTLSRHVVLWRPLMLVYIQFKICLNIMHDQMKIIHYGNIN